MMSLLPNRPSSSSGNATTMRMRETLITLFDLMRAPTPFSVPAVPTSTSTTIAGTIDPREFWTPAIVARVMQNRNTPVSISANDEVGGSVAYDPVMDQWWTLYTRLGETIRMVWRESNMEWSHKVASPASQFSSAEAVGNDSLRSADIINDVYAYTIATTEFRARGSPFTSPPSLYSEQSISLLRYFGEAVCTYVRIAASHRSPVTPGIVNISNMSKIHARAFERLRWILFLSTPSTASILTIDPLFLISELSCFAAEAFQLDFYYYARLCYYLQVTRVIMAMLEEIVEENQLGKTDCVVTLHQRLASEVREEPEEEVEHTKELFMTIAKNSHIPMTDMKSVTEVWTKEHWCLFTRIVKRFTEPFLRQLWLLAHARFGLYQSTTTPQADFDFLLNEMPFLPPLSLILTDEPSSQNLIKAWCQQHVEFNLKPPSSSLMASTAQQQERILGSIPLVFPAQLSLLTLPYKLDQLLDWTLEKQCPRCKLVPADPGLCLFCGALVCCQSFCCGDGDDGECHSHAQT